MNNLYVPNMYSAIHLMGFQYAVREKGWTYPNHHHNYFEFIHCVSGTIHQWINGQLFVLGAGDSLLIKAYSYHHTEIPEETIVFGFHFDIEDRNVHSVFLMQNDPFINKNIKLTSIQNIDEWVFAFIEDFADVLKNPIGQTDSVLTNSEALIQSVFLLQVQSRFLQLIGFIANLLITRTKGMLDNVSLTPSQIEIAHKAAYFMEQGVNENIKIHDLSNGLNIHRSYLNQCFKTLYGITPSEYYKQIRLREAKRMLRISDLSIEKISTDLKFSSPGHFTQFFKSAVGCTPLHYRKSF